jgi:signal transduction histidine kinase
MTVYDARRLGRVRVTLRLRLALLGGALVLAAGWVLLLLTWLIVGAVLRPENPPKPGTPILLVDGRQVEVGGWLDGLVGDAEWQLIGYGAAALVVAGGLGLAGGYLVTRRALSPLHQVTATARRLSGETLDERIRYAGPDDEVAELAATFDAMLDRIAVTFDSQKRFVANASHELRTPLAVMRTEVDVTLSDPEADMAEYRRMATVVRDASIRANALVEALLLLARTEAQAGRRLARKLPVDLAACAGAALSAVDPELRRTAVEVIPDLAAAQVVGDPGLLERLAGNLVENAVRYNNLHGQLWISTGSDRTYSWLLVANTGFEVEQSDVPLLFEPFRRGGRERTGARGSGLGLSIVRAVCDAHGGTVSAVARAGGGLEVTVRLPAAATTPVLTGTAAVPSATPAHATRRIERP